MSCLITWSLHCLQMYKSLHVWETAGQQSVWMEDRIAMQGVLVQSTKHGGDIRGYCQSECGRGNGWICRFQKLWPTENSCQNQTIQRGNLIGKSKAIPSLLPRNMTEPLSSPKRVMKIPKPAETKWKETGQLSRTCHRSLLKIHCTEDKNLMSSMSVHTWHKLRKYIFRNFFFFHMNDHNLVYISSTERCVVVCFFYSTPDGSSELKTPQDKNS